MSVLPNALTIEPRPGVRDHLVESWLLYQRRGLYTQFVKNFEVVWPIEMKRSARLRLSISRDGSELDLEPDVEACFNNADCLRVKEAFVQSFPDFAPYVRLVDEDIRDVQSVSDSSDGHAAAVFDGQPPCAKPLSPAAHLASHDMDGQDLPDFSLPADLFVDSLANEDIPSFSFTPVPGNDFDLQFPAFDGGVAGASDDHTTNTASTVPGVITPPDPTHALVTNPLLSEPNLDDFTIALAPPPAATSDTAAQTAQRSSNTSTGAPVKLKSPATDKHLEKRFQVDPWLLDTSCSRPWDLHSSEATSWTNELFTSKQRIVEF